VKEVAPSPAVTVGAAGVTEATVIVEVAVFPAADAVTMTVA